LNSRENKVKSQKSKREQIQKSKVKKRKEKSQKIIWSGHDGDHVEDAVGEELIAGD
jgi:hypothetical protein